jgi:hypothetical protein
MHWCVTGFIASLLALIAAVAFQSWPMLMYAVVMGSTSGLIAWFGSEGGSVPGRSCSCTKTQNWVALSCAQPV